MSTATILAFDAPNQVLLGGAMRGLAIGVMAVGLILIYRSCRVINFALGELGALVAAVFVRLVINWHWNYWAAFGAAALLGLLAGALLELALVRRLGKGPRVVLLVATIGAAQLLLFLQFVLPDLAINAQFPVAFDTKWEVGDMVVRADHVVAAVVLPLLVIGLGIFLNRTKHGIAVRASAENEDAARLAGISTKRVSMIVWSLAGLLAVVATIVAAPLAGANAASTGNLGPSIMLRTLAAAVIAGMASFPLAVAAGIAIGVADALIFYNNPTNGGLVDVLLLVVVLVAVLVVSFRSPGLNARERLSLAPRVRPIPPALRDVWWVRHHARIGGTLALLLGVLLPVLVASESRQFLYSRMLLMALIALSLTVLTGWSGQLSLGQFALVGIGGLTTYALVENRLVLPVAIVVGAVVAGCAAVIVGAPALRMRGLFLAVSTLALAVATPWILGRSVFIGSESPSSLLLERPTVLGVDLASQRTFFWVCLTILALAVVVMARLRRSGIGRTLLAVRDNERAAAGMGLSPARTKLTAFAVAGVVAGLAGGMFVALIGQFGVNRFQATDSLTVVAIAVVGGLSSIAGTVLGALFIVGLPAFFPDQPEIGLLTSGIGLLILLLYFPGGLVQILYNARDLAFARLAARRPANDVAPSAPTATRATDSRRRAVLTDRPRAPEGTDAVLVTSGVSVRFGTRRVVDDVSLTIGPGEIVGLIGTNGAGKSTLMNAIGGFVPSTGRVDLLGRDVSDLAPHRRARLGLGRTFQDAALFPDLTVRETVAVAVESRGRAGIPSVALALPRAARLERAKQARVSEILDLLGLGPYAERFISELSTGMRRIVELACLVASDASVLCLDEPTAGVAQRETEAFGPLLVRLRQEMNASMLVIEHDMPLVMSISDRVYCLEAGAVIASGTPDEVRNDPLVIASYLGTDETAIARSGALPPSP